jgi:hypothetical protein
MGTWVEVNDEGAAIAAGNRVSELGNGLTMSTPPVADWGDDDFGQTMKSQYPFEAEGEIREAKQNIRDHLLSAGRGVSWAVSTVVGQDQEEGAVFTRLPPPEV